MCKNNRSIKPNNHRLFMYKFKINFLKCFAWGVQSGVAAQNKTFSRRGDSVFRFMTLHQTVWKLMPTGYRFFAISKLRLLMV